MTTDSPIVDSIHDMLNLLAQGVPVEVPDEYFEQFGKACADALRSQMTPRKVRGTIRMSNLGRQDRYLWYVVNEPDKEEPVSPDLMIRFMYGDLTEALVLFLTKAAGNEVSNEQEKVQLSGSRGTISGAKDCHINGELWDVKSASGYAFRTKFKERGLESDDPFGYRLQLAGYSEAHPKPDKVGGLLVLCKQTCELLEYRFSDNSSEHTISNASSEETARGRDEATRRLDEVLELVEHPIEPLRCYPPKAFGKQGNEEIGFGCQFCGFREHCYREVNSGQGLRKFRYRGYNGQDKIVYLSRVVVEPRVEEVK